MLNKSITNLILIERQGRGCSGWELKSRARENYINNIIKYNIIINYFKLY